MKSCDLAIIGSGPAGYVAGLYGSRQKLKICVIEKALTGGTCLNKGCIPTKVMLNSASLYSRIKEAGIHGIEVDNCRINFSKILARRNEVVTRLRAGIETLFRGSRVELIRGAAELTGNNAIRIDNKDVVEAGSVIIATGSRVEAIPGITIDEKDILSSDGILELKELPKSLAVIGGGVIGCEFACLFNLLGAQVSIIELCDRLLPSQSKEASRKLESIFKKRGIEIFTSSSVDSIKKEAMPHLTLKDGTAIQAEKVLVAAGRRSNIEGLGLEKAGIKIENKAIAVDGHLRTAAKNIYAAGDCIAGPLLAQKASYDGILACDNVLGRERSINYQGIPGCIYTDPEIASVGMTEDEARAGHPGVKIAKFPYLASGKSYLLGKTEGFVKIVGDDSGNLLGAEILGEGACDLIGEMAMAINFNINIKDLARVAHGHPTLSEILQEAAQVFCGTAIHSV